MKARQQWWWREKKHGVVCCCVHSPPRQEQHLSLSLFSPQTNTCNLQPWEVSVGSFPPGRRLIGQPGLKFTLVYFWDFGPRVMSSGAFLFYYWKCCKLENMYPWIGLEETTRRKTKGVEGESKENLGWMSLPYSFLCCCLDSGWEVSRVLALFTISTRNNLTWRMQSPCFLSSYPTTTTTIAVPSRFCSLFSITIPFLSWPSVLLSVLVQWSAT